MNWFGWFAILAFLGLILINVQVNPRRVRRFCRRLGIPDEQLNNVRNGLFGAGVILIVAAAIIWFNNVRLSLIASGFLLVCLILSVVFITRQSRSYMAGNPAQRDNVSWSLRSFWIPFLISLLIIMAVFSC